MKTSEAGSRPGATASPNLLNFGRYQGCTLERLLFIDPGYAVWLATRDRQLARLGADERDRFKQLLLRADNLAIPSPCQWCGLRPVEQMVLIENPNAGGGLARVTFNCSKCHPPASSSFLVMAPSMLVADALEVYDKAGGDVLIRAVKRAYWGDPGYRMTQARLEAFFDDPQNFTLF